MLSRLTIATLAALGFACGSPYADADTSKAALTVHPMRTQKPSDDVIRKELNDTQYDVTQRDGTEPPFHNEYWDNHAAGIYVDIVTGEPLFSSTNKFDSGTGWPSFYQTIAPNVLQAKHDGTHGMDREEVRSKIGNSHLGHVFDDGPQPTGLRYCINSAAIRFVPVDQLAAQGYSQYAPLFKK